MGVDTSLTSGPLGRVFILGIYCTVSRPSPKSLVLFIRNRMCILSVEARSLRCKSKLVCDCNKDIIDKSKCLGTFVLVSYMLALEMHY